MGYFAGSRGRYLGCAAIVAGILLPFCSWGAESSRGGEAAKPSEGDRITVKSEILFEGAEDFVPPEHDTDEAGAVYDLENWTMVPVKTEAKEVKVRQTVIFEKVEKKEAIPQEYGITAEENVTGRNLVRNYPILDMAVKKERWEEDFSFPIVFHAYDADYYELGEEKIPYDEEKPQLEGYEEELLELIGADAENYRIQDVKWDGEPYLDDGGILCRRALAYGSRRTADYAVIYGGTAVFPETEGMCCEMVYAIPEAERKSAADIEVLPADVSEPEQEPETQVWEDGWRVIKRGIFVTVTLFFVLLILLLAVLLIRRWKAVRKKRQREPYGGIWMIPLILLFLASGSRTAWGRFDGGFKKIDETWHHFDSGGRMDTGWRYLDGYWYFFSRGPGTGGGRMMTGWQWIDGACYYLEEREEKPPENSRLKSSRPYGAMYAGEQTPDGYWVNDQGKWVDKEGVVQLKPYQRIGFPKEDEPRYARGTGTGAHALERRKSDAADPAVHPDSEPPQESGDSEKADSGADTATPSEGYRRDVCASPSEALKSGWSIFFVEQDHPAHEIFKRQTGQSEEGTELVVDFPETILGTDGFYYDAVQPSPCTVLITGAGEQKYSVGYLRRAALKPEDPDRIAKDRLKDWIRTAAGADLLITGTEPSIQQLITDTRPESDERMRNIVSAVDDSDRHEIYLIGRGHLPNSLIPGLSFSNVTSVSELLADTFSIGGVKYSIVRIGFRKFFKAENCNHRLVIHDYVPADCLANGHETVSCSKCDFEETVILPAAGHQDQNGDGICDVCFEVTDGAERPDPVHYDIGDIQVRRIGDRLCLFRCIDDDYKDAADNSRHTALFLCDTVIRSDTAGGTGQAAALRYGADNNYKHSDVRAWLNRHASDSLSAAAVSYTGIKAAYSGSTRAGKFEDFDETGLAECEKPFQLMEDWIFLLSVEEAVKYRDFLWKFNGSPENNPQTQYSAYSRGYYLRTPQYAGNGRFRYGSGVYAVDLNGSLRPVDVGSRDIGIRPVISVVQG